MLWKRKCGCPGRSESDDGAGPADSVCADPPTPTCVARGPGRPPGLLWRLSDGVVRVELPGSTARRCTAISAREASRRSFWLRQNEHSLMQARRPAVRAGTTVPIDLGSSGSQNPLMPLATRPAGTSTGLRRGRAGGLHPNARYARAGDPGRRYRDASSRTKNSQPLKPAVRSRSTIGSRSRGAPASAAVRSGAHPPPWSSDPPRGPRRTRSCRPL